MAYIQEWELPKALQFGFESVKDLIGKLEEVKLEWNQPERLVVQKAYFDSLDLGGNHLLHPRKLSLIVGLWYSKHIFSN
jgi:hypothetical protein